MDVEADRASCATNRSVESKIHERRVRLSSELQPRVKARAYSDGGRIPRFLSRYAVEYVCVVGFIRRRLNLHRSMIRGARLSWLVDLRHRCEQRWLHDFVEPRSGRQ